MRLAGALILALAVGPCLAAELDRTPIEAATADGEKVRLFPNGRWEFVVTHQAVSQGLPM